MTPRQTIRSAAELVKNTWETWLILGAIITAGTTALRSYDRVINIVENDSTRIIEVRDQVYMLSKQLSYMNTLQDSVFRWRMNVNSLFCSPIYPERQLQASLLGMCDSGRVLPIKPPRVLKPR